MSLYIWPETKVFIDASVLYQAQLRDLFMQLAVDNTFILRWSQKVQDEWTSRLLEKRPDLPALISRTVKMMNLHLPNGLVPESLELGKQIELPDPNDVHVLVAAIQCNADILLTENLRDFPEEILQGYDLEVCSSDRFLSRICELQPQRIKGTVDAILDRLKHPKITLEKYCERLNKIGFSDAAAQINQLYSSA